MAETQPKPSSLTRLVILAAVFGIFAGLTAYLGLRYYFGVELLKALGFGNF